jgi:protein TonB
VHRPQHPRILLALLLAAACKPPAPTLSPPTPLGNAMPAPERVAETQAAKDGKQGAVKIAYCIDTDGKPQDVRVVEPLEPEFDALALETVGAWRFEPATRDGAAVEQCTDVRIELRPAAE